MSDVAQDLLDSMSDLLHSERRLLLAGDLDGLGRTIALKESLLARIGSARLPENRLRRLRLDAARNAELLTASARGLRAAMARVKALTDGPEPLTTYDRQGQRSNLSTPVQTLEKRI